MAVHLERAPTEFLRVHKKQTAGISITFQYENQHCAKSDEAVYIFVEIFIRPTDSSLTIFFELISRILAKHLSLGVVPINFAKISEITQFFVIWLCE